MEQLTTIDALKPAAEAASSFKLYTENKQFEKLVSLFSDQFASYTIWFGRGAWQGDVESSLCFEIINSDDETIGKLKTIAARIKQINEQDAVLIIRQALDYCELV